MIRNPFHIGIETSLGQIRLLCFALASGKGETFVPALVALLGWSIVLLASMLLYPYGMFPMVAALFATLVKDTRAAMGRGKKVTAKKNCSCVRRKQSSVMDPSCRASRYGLCRIWILLRMASARALTRGTRLGWFIA